MPTNLDGANFRLFDMVDIPSTYSVSIDNNFLRQAFIIFLVISSNNEIIIKYCNLKVWLCMMYLRDLMTCW